MGDAAEELPLLGSFSSASADDEQEESPKRTGIYSSSVTFLFVIFICFLLLRQHC
jgi:hypothetical protein